MHNYKRNWHWKLGVVSWGKNWVQSNMKVQIHISLLSEQCLPFWCSIVLIDTIKCLLCEIESCRVAEHTTHNNYDFHLHFSCLSAQVSRGPFDVFDDETETQMVEKFLNLGDNRNIAEVYVQVSCWRSHKNYKHTARYLLGSRDALLCVRAAILRFCLDACTLQVSLWGAAVHVQSAELHCLCASFRDNGFQAIGLGSSKVWVHQNIVDTNHMCKLRSHQQWERPKNDLRQYFTSLCPKLSKHDSTGVKLSPRGQHLACSTSCHLHQRKCCAVHSWLAFLRYIYLYTYMYYFFDVCTISFTPDICLFHLQGCSVTRSAGFLASEEGA